MSDFDEPSLRPGDRIRVALDVEVVSVERHGHGPEILVQADWRGEYTDPQFRQLYVEPSEVQPADSIDAAWTEAEAALPEGWHIDRLNRNGPQDWTAYASEAPHLGLEMGAHNTPAAALRALTTRLKAR